MTADFHRLEDELHRALDAADDLRCRLAEAYREIEELRRKLFAATKPKARRVAIME
jgi:hypothetical protein